MEHCTLNIKGRLVSLAEPLIMGILNVTSDSFYANSRKQTEAGIHGRVEEILAEGGDIIDIGGYSSRPGATAIPADEEMNRLSLALRIMRDEYPGVLSSVDTFRSEVARHCVEVYGAALINDISGGELDRGMFSTVASLRVPYIMMHMRGTPQTMQQHCGYTNLAADILLYFSKKLEELHLLGIADVIIDPGFGFSKTLEQNYELMRHLPDFKLLGKPLMVGISRKSMIYNLLGSTPEESLNGTTVLNTYALLHGADILRVHDVKEAVEARKLVKQLIG